MASLLRQSCNLLYTQYILLQSTHCFQSIPSLASVFGEHDFGSSPTCVCLSPPLAVANLLKCYAVALEQACNCRACEYKQTVCISRWHLFTHISWSIRQPCACDCCVLMVVRACLLQLVSVHARTTLTKVSPPFPYPVCLLSMLFWPATAISESAWQMHEHRAAPTAWHRSLICSCYPNSPCLQAVVISAGTPRNKMCITWCTPIWSCRLVENFLPVMHRLLKYENSLARR